ncbi:MAG TPA: hypothetical protein PK694_03415 [Rhodospirillales bacterium]|nr:hypothetical protein [Rhodospirillales bacterium]
MPNSPTHPLAQLDALLRRHDGPPPADELLAALAGEPADVLRRRAISGEIDRLALSLSRSIANRRARLLPLRGDCERERLAMAELSRSLADYRNIAMSLSRPPGRT